MKNKKETDGQTLMRGANELAAIVFSFLASNKDYQPFTMGIVGYASEMLLRYFSASIGKPFDDVSEEYRKFLEQVHEDIKKAEVTMNQNVN